ncbi:MAG: HAD-IA family hydrolase [Treponema sp.]|nr:HAD-IA family hydrolase [Treponema sp.]
MIKLVIFDMDGTLLNTIDDLATATNYALEKNGFPLRTTDEIKQFVGNGVEKLIERALGEENISHFDEVYADFLPYYSAHSKDKTCAYDGVIDLLKELKNRGIKLAVNTNKPQAPAAALTEEYFPGLFDYTCGAKPENDKKPSPDGCNEIMKLFGISKEETIYIGDSDVDYLTGKNAQVHTISVTWGFRTRSFLEEKGAVNFIDKPDQLLEYL